MSKDYEDNNEDEIMREHREEMELRRSAPPQVESEVEDEGAEEEPMSSQEAWLTLLGIMVVLATVFGAGFLVGSWLAG